MTCQIYLPLDYNEGEKYYPTIYVNGEIPVNDILTRLVENDIPTDFILLSIRSKNWNDDFTPWPAAAFRKGEEPPHGMADAYL
ncbi:MAG: alpha/beta hydrolase, partial [Lachnospiraceae bacterium]|nr:alpha/beta hydrolase [Lachnospiraceae bacterium]